MGTRDDRYGYGYGYAVIDRYGYGYRYAYPYLYLRYGYVAMSGWDEGVVTMSLRERATLTIGSDFGYGRRGVPGTIPPNHDCRTL